MFLIISHYFLAFIILWFRPCLMCLISPLFWKERNLRNTLNLVQQSNCRANFICKVPSNGDGEYRIMGFEKVGEQGVNIIDTTSNTNSLRLKIINFLLCLLDLNRLRFQLNVPTCKFVHDFALNCQALLEFAKRWRNWLVKGRVASRNISTKLWQRLSFLS